VVTAYTLSFGGLLLLGGRIADYVGRKRVFIIGLLGFAGASALGGVAVDAPMLFGARLGIDRRRGCVELGDDGHGDSSGWG
jgi:MFS family permease